MSVSAVPPTVFSNPTGDQQIDFLSGTNVNAALINELVGANTPLLGTNTVPLGILTGLDTNGLPIPLTDYASNAVVTVINNAAMKLMPPARPQPAAATT